MMSEMTQAPHKRILVTGGAGFIGSALVQQLLRETDVAVLNFDALTYAGNRSSLREAESDSKYGFIQADICDSAAVAGALKRFEPDAVIHLAAESHVDRSIDAPGAFVKTNVDGTVTLLQGVTGYWRNRPKTERAHFRFLHISTDEVYGSLGDDGLFSETTPYAPRSPYSASKAAADHFVKAWHHTYGLPVLITNCSNNYGPRQYPEKLIPIAILNALELQPLPLYGRGDNVRDWLYVDDHVRALRQVLQRGLVGETYNIGGSCERTNLEVVKRICSLLDELKPRADGRSYQALITFVTDRPGHDKRYAIDAAKLRTQLGWQAQVGFDAGMLKTVRWYLENEWWWHSMRGLVRQEESLGCAGGNQA